MNEYPSIYSRVTARLYEDMDTRFSYSYLVLRADCQEQKIPLEKALAEGEPLSPVFVYTALKYGGETPEELTERVYRFLAGKPFNRAVIWIPTGGEPSILGFDFSGENGQTLSSCAIVLAQKGRSFKIVKNVPFKFEQGGQCISFPSSPTAPPFVFNGQPFPHAVSYTGCTLYLGGEKRGVLAFEFDVDENDFFMRFNPGLRVVYNEKGEIFYYYFDFSQKKCAQSNNYLRFDVSINPCDIYNAALASGYDAHTTFMTLKNGGCSFVSSYQTVYGDFIPLIPETSGGENSLPARFCFVDNPPDTDQQQLCPEGDFTIADDFGPRNELLCGLNGTEFVTFRKGDRLRFLSSCPAYVKEIVSGPPEVGKEYDPDAPRLLDDYRTSWCVILGQAPQYVSQPRGFPFYGDAGGDSLLSHEKPGVDFPKEAFVPLFPYGAGQGTGCFNEALEEHAVSVDRRRLLNQSSHPLPPGLRAGESKTITTPNGQIVELDGTGWRTISLAYRNGDGGASEKIYFEKPDEELVNAFQSPNLFLVAANGAHLGAYAPDSSPANKQAFHNRIHLGEWLLKCDIGEDSDYGEYANIMVVKGCRGKLYDPDNESASLVLNTGAWCARTAFSSPVTGKSGEPDPSQQPLLANWLLEYFKSAINEGETEYFANFNAIAQDANWQGVLFLNLPLSMDNLPSQMAGVLSGIPTGETLFIHHWGITLNTIKQDGGTISYEKDSSLFGLIYYRDKAIPNGVDAAVVSPDYGDYNFRLLTLKALFESSSVKSFQCYTQLSVNKFMGMSVSGMGEGGNVYNAVLMKGTFQDSNGTPVFFLRSEGQNTFLFSDNAIRAMGLTGVEMSAVSIDPNKPENSEFRFVLEGVIDFAVADPDVFSFGTTEKETQGEAGLFFSGLELAMRRSGDAQIFEVRNTGIKFDGARSRVRDTSLYHNFKLEIGGLIIGSDKTTLETLGYAYLPAPFSADMLSGEWYGLSCAVKLGTLGDLAGRVGLTASLLIGWKPGEKGACVALSLPGTGDASDFLSIQNILKLSVGSLRIGYFAKEQVFFIMLNDVALKVFGIAKLPPAGSTGLYIYGASGNDAPLGWYAQYRGEE